MGKEGPGRGGVPNLLGVFPLPFFFLFPFLWRLGKEEIGEPDYDGMISRESAGQGQDMGIYKPTATAMALRTACM